MGNLNSISSFYLIFAFIFYITIMTYTIKITDDKTSQAQNLLKFLKSLSKDYPFLQISEDKDIELTEEMIAELDTRYDHFVKNAAEYKNWEEIKQKYVKG
jgi:hypothetical protein